MSQDKPIWLQPGPAEKLYQHFLQSEPIVTQWLNILRETWGNPGHPDLNLFQNIEQQCFTIPATIDEKVEVTRFTPSDATSDVFVYIHGGGWISPTAGKHLAWAKKMAYLSNISVVSVNYRLAPEYPFPAALNDCITAYQYYRNATHGRVFIGGDSAGGNLAAAVCLYCSENNITMPDKLLCLCGLTDFYFEQYDSIFTLGTGNPRGDTTLLAFQRYCYVPRIEDWKNPYVSPIYGDLAQMPSTLVLIASDDPLRDDNRAFAKRLEEFGVKVKTLEYPQMPHTFYTYPEYLPEQAKKANADMVEYMLS